MAELGAAARSIYVDVREAILGPVASPVGRGRAIGAAVAPLRATGSPRRRSSLVVGPPRPGLGTAAGSRQSPGRRSSGSSQEALTNVRKHAAAQRVTVAMETRDGRLRRSPSPTTGAGFDPATVRRWPGRLAALRADDRCASGPTPIGGPIDWSSRARGRRDAWICVVPLDAAGAAAVEAARCGILLADDHALFRDGVASLLGAWGHEVVGRPADGEAGRRR